MFAFRVPISLTVILYLSGNISCKSLVSQNCIFNCRTSSDSQATLLFNLNATGLVAYKKSPYENRTTTKAATIKTGRVGRLLLRPYCRTFIFGGNFEWADIHRLSTEAI